MDDPKLLPILGRITRSISSEKPLETILKLVAREVARLLQANTCAIMLVGETGQELLFKQSYGLSRRELELIRFKLGEGIAGWSTKHRKPALLSDVTKDARFKSFEIQKNKIASLLCVPLLLQSQAIGVISVTSPQRDAFRKQDQTLLEHLAAHTALEIENHRLYEISVTDELTRLYNRRYFHRRLQYEIDRAFRFRESLAVCLADLDDFGRVNEAGGRTAGDALLAAAAGGIRKDLRSYDVVARWGADEFVVLFTNTDRDAVVKVVDRLRAALRAVSSPLTASFGVVVYPEDGADADDLLAQAERALARARKRGGDRWEVG